MPEEIIARGAEAILIKKNKRLIKRRIKKSYRHKDLDFLLRKMRTRHESRIMEKASRFIDVPKIKDVRDFEIEMEFIKGKLLSECLDTLDLKKALEICKLIGKQIALMHNANIIHNDLTTSNMILKEEKNNIVIYFIDFGLSFHSARIEDKAVDLHLLKEALKAKHFKRWQYYFKAILEGYKAAENHKKIIERLKKVETRGRYKRKKKVKLWEE